MLNRFLVVAGLGLALFLSACSTSYVNIPATAGDVASHNPNRRDVLKVTMQALRYLGQDVSGQGYGIRLPAGTSRAAYDAVIPQLGAGVVDASELDPAGPVTVVVLDARQVRIRAGFAEVDILRPGILSQPDSTVQMTTVYLDYDTITGWHATRSHTWRMKADDALLYTMRSDQLAEPR